MQKRIFVFLFDGFSDWEIAYLTPGINQSELFELVYFSENANLLTSMGGLQIKPTTSLHDITPEDIDMLILPGGTAWEKREITTIDELITSVLEKEKPIAAICAATTYLAQLGLLNDIKHTSNGLAYLKALVPGYLGEEHYQDAPAVTDKNIITANGTAPVEFAKEIFRTIGLYPDEHIEQWFQLFKHGVWSE